ncbi:MAG: hypothetical protein LBD46_06640 [Endomicrobium sp.]|jgi:hypothetical protein|nr:hypothetical protein [Endomicrobium sp.]
MSVIFDPKAYLKKVLPKGFEEQSLLYANDIEVKKTVLRSLTAAKAINGREIKSSIYNSVNQYKNKYEELLNQGATKSEAYEEATNGEALLKQRIYSTLIYDEVQELKEEHYGEYYMWLPSDAQTPDPQHQLLYGKVFKVGEGDKNGFMPGERWGCQCGIDFIGNYDKEKILKNTDKRFIADTQRLYNEAINKKNIVDTVEFRTVESAEAARLKKNIGFDLNGYNYELRLIDVKHILNNHGDFATEKARNQIAVKARDLALISEITKNYNSVSMKVKNNGTKSIKYMKVIGNEYYYVEVVGTQKKRLLSKTMYIKKK